MGRIDVKWLGEESRMFVGRDTMGRTVVAGYWQKPNDPTWTEARGAKASDLLVIALASCSAYDLVDILQKQREPLASLSISADAEQAPQPPWQFTKIHLHYQVTGKGLDAKKVERAIKLSEEKYCSVAATIRGVTEITHSLEICPEA
ncbi:MAG: OsmC family protein [Nitrososphaerales archaeon]